MSNGKNGLYTVQKKNPPSPLWNWHCTHTLRSLLHGRNPPTAVEKTRLQSLHFIILIVITDSGKNKKWGWKNTGSFTIVKRWKQPKSPLVDQWIHKIWCTHTTEYYPAIKKKQSTNSRYNVDEPSKHAKWEKSDTKSHILCDSVYMKCPEEANPEREQRSEVARGWRESGEPMKRFEASQRQLVTVQHWELTG